MSRTNGGRPPQGKTPQSVTTMCPWHLQGWPHPTGAPDCEITPTLERRINLATLVHWVTLSLTSVAHLLGQMIEAAQTDDAEADGQVITDEIPVRQDATATPGVIATGVGMPAPAPEPDDDDAR